MLEDLSERSEEVCDGDLNGSGPSWGGYANLFGSSDDTDSNTSRNMVDNKTKHIGKIESATALLHLSVMTTEEVLSPKGTYLATEDMPNTTAKVNDSSDGSSQEEDLKSITENDIGSIEEPSFVGTTISLPEANCLWLDHPKDIRFMWNSSQIIDVQRTQSLAKIQECIECQDELVMLRSSTVPQTEVLERVTS